METLVTREQAEREMESYIPEIHAFINDVSDRRVEKALHDERYKTILRKQHKRARIREITRGIAALLGCFFLPVISATAFNMPELVTTEMIFAPLGIYFLWEAL